MNVSICPADELKGGEDAGFASLFLDQVESPDTDQTPGSRKASITEKRLLEEPTWRKKPLGNRIPDLSSVVADTKNRA